MKSLNQLWRIFEREQVLVGVEAQWQLWLGGPVDVLRPYLAPEQDLASSYPCENNPEYCTRRVVHHGPDDIVAVCGLDPPECDRLPLSRSDVIVYELALERFLPKIAEVIDCVGGVQKVAGTRAWSVGFRSGNTQVFFVLPSRGVGYAVPIAMLLAQHPMGELAVLVPRTRSLAGPERALLSQRRATILSCDELVGADHAGRLVRVRPEASHLELVKPPQSADSCPMRPVAIGWRDGEEAKTIAVEELDRWRAFESEVEHFVDATLNKPRCSKRNGEDEREVDRLTPGQVSLLAAYLARATRKLDQARPETLRVPNLSTAASRKKAFNELRRKVDITAGSRRRYRLFKDRSSYSGGPQEYEFRPDDGATFCFILRFEHYQTVETAVTR
jgi:hypothetical protein